MEKRGRFLNKKGDILIGNVVFIILVLVFLAILISFIISKTGNAADIEEEYAKQIALMIDSAKSGMTLRVEMPEAFERAKEENYDGRILFFNDNIVTVKLREKGGYSYSFFNDVEISDLREGEDYYSFKIKSNKEENE